MHSGLKSSFVTFIPTHMVPIEPVNVTLSRRSIMQTLISIYFNSKCPVVNTAAFLSQHSEVRCHEGYPRRDVVGHE